VRKWVLIAVLALTSVPVFGQGNAVILSFPGVPSGSCAFVMLGLNASNGDTYSCPAGSWVKIGGGGAVAFSAVTSGANTATLQMDTGGSLAAINAGTIDATTLLTKTWATPAAIGTGTPAAGTFTSVTITGTSPSVLTAIADPSCVAKSGAWFYSSTTAGIFKGCNATPALFDFTYILDAGKGTSGHYAKFSADGIGLIDGGGVLTINDAITLNFGFENGAVLLDADLGPGRKQKQLPAFTGTATIYEIDVAADDGTPQIIPAIRVCTASPCKTGANETVSNLVSAALATAANGGTACSRTAAVTGVDGFTTCTNTLQNNTSIAGGTYFESASGTAGGTAKALHVTIHFTRPLL
jgi:hypothetical protein